MKLRALFAALLLVVACRGTATDPNAPYDWEHELTEAVRVFGESAVQFYFGQAMREQAPEAFRLLDKDGDNMLTATELLAVDWKSPVTHLVLFVTIDRLRKR